MKRYETIQVHVQCSPLLAEGPRSLAKHNCREPRWFLILLLICYLKRVNSGNEDKLPETKLELPNDAEVGLKLEETFRLLN